MKEKKRCEATIFDDFRNYQCFNKAKVECDGKWYCGVHDPVRKKEKQDAQDRKWNEERDAEKEQLRRRLAERNYCENLTTEYLETHQGG